MISKKTIGILILLIVVWIFIYALSTSIGLRQALVVTFIAFSITGMILYAMHLITSENKKP